jgi:hypothetical protein
MPGAAPHLAEARRGASRRGARVAGLVGASQGITPQRRGQVRLSQLAEGDPQTKLLQPLARRLAGAGSREAAQHVADRVLAKARKPFEIDVRQLCIGASIGVVTSLLPEASLPERQASQTA